MHRPCPTSAGRWVPWVRRWRLKLGQRMGRPARSAVVSLGLLLCRMAAAADGAVWTVAGQEYRGPITLTSNGLRVGRAPGQSVEIPFTELRRAVFGLGPDLAGFGPLQGGWEARDVGGLNATGWAAQADRAFVLQVLGTASQEKSETLHFVYQPATGQAELTAHVLELAGPEGQTRASLTVRESLVPGGAFALVGINSGGGLCFQARSESGKKARTVALPQVTLPQWLRLVKHGAQCSAYSSADGRQWRLVGTTNVSLGQRFYVGLALSAEGAFRLAQARFDSVGLVVSGLRGEYFADPDFGKLACVRVDSPVQFVWGHKPPAESVPADRFSVRWTGQIEPERTDDYTFHLDTEGAARLWIDGRLVAAREPDKAGSAGALAKLESVRLQAGRRYPLRLEYQKTGGPARLTLAWSSSQRSRQVVSADRFYCVAELLPGAASVAGAATADAWPAAASGVWLCSGSFLAGEVRAMDERSIKLGFRGAPELVVPTVRAARVCLRATRQSAPIDSGQRGVLLINGDFLEGEFRGVQGRQLQLSSVLFGLRSLGLDQVATVALRPLAPGPAAFEVHTLDGTRLRAEALVGDAGHLRVQEPGLGPLRVPMEALAEIRRLQG